MIDLVDSKDAESRRAGLRRMLASPEGAIDEALDGRLVHLLADGDARVKILTQAVFLRRSLVHDPPAPLGAAAPPTSP